MAGSSTFAVNEYDVQENNGVLDILESLEDYEEKVPNYMDKEDVQYSFWTRATIPWSLECELSTMTRTEALAIYEEKQIRIYDKSVGDQLKQCSSGFFLACFILPVIIVVGIIIDPFIPDWCRSGREMRNRR